jgi:threo-3-hydroxy-L-aspartate ammonia-lyase
MRFFMSAMKTVVEPTGCLGAAAALAHGRPGARIGVIVSGGNVDPDAFCRHISPESRS